MMQVQYHTIAAISTPPGKGGVAIIRISGDEAFNIAKQCFVPMSKKQLQDYPYRFAIYGHILFEGKEIDDGIITLYPNPHSYTGEDMVEICCHGGILLTQKVLTSVLAAGAYMAGPGEFTQRAFQNGKLSLSHAEAVGQLLEAKTEAQIALAAPTSRNAFQEAVSDIGGILLSLLSSLYATIDYPDEDLGELSDADIISRIQNALSKTEALRKTYRIGHAISEGIRTVICGRPNVGKSSLYNTLCGDEYAIVTDEAGTTRDVLERVTTTGAITLHLYDTAGIRDTDSVAEMRGVERSLWHIKQAELILAVFDGSAMLTSEDKLILEEIKSHANGYTIALINKSDLPQQIEMDEIARVCQKVVSISAKTGNIENLIKLLDTLYIDEKIAVGSSAIVSTARQEASLAKTESHMKAALEAFSLGLAQDVASSDVELALASLGELDGREVSEQIVADIFSHFCVGK